MALTRDFKKTVVARVERDPAFAKALLDEAATLFLSDEPETARVILRDLVNATLGFEQLAKMTATPSKSLHRMLSPKVIRAWIILPPSLARSAAALKWDLESILFAPHHRAPFAKLAGCFLGYELLSGAG
jgi:hypothetical protein